MGVANISWITPDLATGGDFSYDPAKAARQFDELMAAELDLVIDCRSEANDERVWAATEVQYLHLPTDDALGHHISAEHFATAVKHAVPVIDSGGKVLVHCHMGINRGPSTAYAIMLALGWDWEDAYLQIMQARPQAGIEYAEDALRAHFQQQGEEIDTLMSVSIDFRRFLKEFWTPEKFAAVNRYIKRGHETDHRERFQLRV